MPYGLALSQEELSAHTAASAMETALHLIRLNLGISLSLLSQMQEERLHIGKQTAKPKKWSLRFKSPALNTATIGTPQGFALSWFMHSYMHRVVDGTSPTSAEPS